MDQAEIKHVVEAALLAAGRPLTLDRLTELFTAKGAGPDRATVKQALEALANDYEGRGIELKEVASGYRVQVKRTMTDWLTPLWEERAPRYTRALLETLALIAYRQPITRGEIEEVRGVVVSTNIIRTLLERNWIRVVGHRDVPGKPAMFGTTREFLDYFGLKRLEDLPTLAEIKDGLPELSPQTDLIDSLEAEARMMEMSEPAATDGSATVAGEASEVAAAAAAAEATEVVAGEVSEAASGEAARPADDAAASSSVESVDDEEDGEPAFETEVEAPSSDRVEDSEADDGDEEQEPGDNVIPLRAAGRDDDE